MANINNRPMYNEEQKLRYINETAASEAVARRAKNIFRAAAPFEEEWGADLCTRTPEELKPFLDKALGLRTRSRYSQLSMIRSYMRWCKETGADGAKEFPSWYATDDDTESVRLLIVRSPEHLQQYMNKAFDKEDDKTQDNAYRAFLWLAYGGMTEECAYEVTCKEVFFDYMEVRRGDETAILYRQGLAAMRNCVTLQEFYYRNGHYVNSDGIWRNRVPGDRILRGIRADQPLQNFRTQVSRRIRQSKNVEGSQSLSYSRVWLAGSFYRLYEREQAGIEPDFTAAAADSLAGRNALKKKTESERRAALADAARIFKNDYTRWKLVVNSI